MASPANTSFGGVDVADVHALRDELAAMKANLVANNDAFFNVTMALVVFCE
jgi:hypothetical protein